MFLFIFSVSVNFPGIFLPDCKTRCQCSSSAVFPYKIRLCGDFSEPGKFAEKTFFGKIKYYFSNRKKELKPVNSSKNKKETLKEEYKKQETILEENKKLYTIEDLIEVCTKLDGRKKMVKNLKLDQKALELKKVNLERKIKNANIYLNEIDLHKKSIFEFWNFTNKDELPSLNEGEKEENKEK